MTAVDNHHAMDFPALDFYHLPFESDLPQDILEFSCATQRDAVDDYSTSILTPPPTAYPSDEEDTFTLGQIETTHPREGSPACVASPALVAGADVGGHFVPSIWATPPASPPLTSFSAPPARFSYPFRAATQPFFDGAASSDDEAFDSYASAPAPEPRRRKSSSGSAAGKAPRKSKDSLASAAAAFAAQRRSRPSPEPTSSAYNSDCEEPEVKRNTHNVLERKRRNDLKRSYQNLRMQLPNLSDQQRAPTGAILSKAAEYIAELRATDARAVATIESLRRENARAHARLRAARAAAAYM